MQIIIDGKLEIKFFQLPSIILGLGKEAGVLAIDTTRVCQTNPAESVSPKIEPCNSLYFTTNRMIYFIVTWTFLFIACGSIGLNLLNWFQSDSFEILGDRAIASLWLGVVVLALSLLATSLVFPLSPLVGGIIILCLSVASLLSARTRTEIAALRSVLSPHLILQLFILAFAIAAFTTRQVTWQDTGLYHYSSIRWLSEFGTVPGIALILSNLGFTSSWFAFAAPFNAEIFESRVSAVTNGFAFFIALLHFLICLARSVTNKSQISDRWVVISSLMTLPLIIVLPQLSQILVSPSPDLPVIFLIQVVAWAILIISNQKTPSLEKVESPLLSAKTIPLLLSIGAVTMKLTALPLLLISGVFYICNRQFILRRVLMGSALTFLLLSPFFISGIITSGCPLYPSSFLCLDLPWSPTAQAAQHVAEHTHSWTSWYDSTESSKNSFFWLFWQWLNSQRLNEAVVLLTVISLVGATYIVRNLKNSRILGQLWLLALAVSGITFLLFTSPFFRFALGYLTILPALSLAIYLSKKLGNIWPQKVENKLKFFSKIINLRKFVLAVSLSLGTWASILLINEETRFQLLLPPQIKKADLVQKSRNDITYFSPKNSGEFCWNSALPCAFTIGEDVKLRNPKQGIKAGFVRNH